MIAVLDGKSLNTARFRGYAFIEEEVADMYIDPEQVKEKIREHMYGPAGSVVFHIILIILLIKFLVFAPTENIADIELELVELETVELEELKEEIEELTEEDDYTENVDAPEPVAEEAPPDPTAVDSPMAELDFDALAIDADFSSPLVLRGLYAGRTSAGRAAMLGRYGGRHGGRSEKAVKLALSWLADHQNENGSWGDASKKIGVGISGLALLTFLAHGETPSSEKYGPTVEKAIRWLLSQQSSAGSIGQKGYAHGIAAYAISEAFAMTRIPALKIAMNQAIDCLIDGQSPEGGWNYGYNNENRLDFSVCGWQMQALKAAKMAGYESEQYNIQQAIDLAIENSIKFQPNGSQFGYSVSRETGPFDYSKAGGKTSMTGVGVLCLQLLGLGRSNSARKGLASLANYQVDWKKGWNDKPGPHGGILYTSYYVTQAKFHAGEGIWKSWNSHFAPIYIKEQHKTGYWDNPHFFNIPDGQMDKNVLNARVYHTTLAALTLMVYYRHLPSYKKIDDAAVGEDEIPAAGGGDVADIDVEII